MAGMGSRARRGSRVGGTVGEGGAVEQGEIVGWERQ